MLKKLWHTLPYNFRVRFQVGRYTRTYKKMLKKIALIEEKYKDDKVYDEIRPYLNYMKKECAIGAFNAEWTRKYIAMPIKIERDSENWPYYMYYGKKCI